LGVHVSYNIKEALEWADVANVLRIQLERQDIKFFPSLREYQQYFGVNRKLLDQLKSEVMIMHPGPINRGVELDSDVADSDQSIILAQVENGRVCTTCPLCYAHFKENAGEIDVLEFSQAYNPDVETET
jgi:aspartate carbamoyltransferase catalytic subunit